MNEKDPTKLIVPDVEKMFSLGVPYTPGTQIPERYSLVAIQEGTTTLVLVNRRMADKILANNEGIVKLCPPAKKMI